MELVSRTPERVEKLLVARNLEPAFAEKLEQAAGAAGLRPQTAPREKMDELADGGVHQGVIAYVTPPKARELSDVLGSLEDGPALLVALDHLQDPRNVGAIARTAEAAGASGLILPLDRSAALTGTVVKTSAGSALRLPFLSVVNLRRSLEELKKEGFWVVGLAGEAEQTLFDDALPERCVIVAGAEGEGLSDLTRKTCDLIVRLPMCHPVESLNASVATGLALYHWARDHRFGGGTILGEASKSDVPEMEYTMPEAEIDWPEEDDFDDFA